MVVKKNRTEDVNDYMAKSDHPMNDVVEEVRKIIKGVNPDILEEVKWNAPSFSYKDYIATFNLRDKSQVHLIFHAKRTPEVKSELLEGNYPDGRRMTYFHGMEDVKAKRAELERIVKELIKRDDSE